LCDAVTDRTDGQALLEQLARANLFILPLDDQGQWYRYHHLFADLLRHYLQQAPPSFLPAVGMTEKGGIANCIAGPRPGMKASRVRRRGDLSHQRRSRF
jgi:hypothetical protein